MDLNALRSRVGFLKQLPASELEWLAPKFELTVLQRGEKFWFEGQLGDRFAIVIRGRVKFARTTQGGRDAVMDLASPGDLACSSPVCGFAPYCCSSVALEDGTELISIQRRHMFELLERVPSMATMVLGEAAKQKVHACDRIEQLSSGQVEQRLATLLVSLARRVGVERPRQGVWIPVPLSRQDLADMCGTTVETIIRTLSRLRKAKLVRPAARGYLVTSPAELEKLARASQGVVELRIRPGTRPKAACG